MTNEKLLQVLETQVRIQQKQINDLNARLQTIIMQIEPPKLLKAPSWTP